MIELVCQLLSLFLIAVFARIVLSWFPISEGSPIASIYSVLYTITEPVLGPLRSILPSVGMLDISPIILIFGVSIIQRAMGCGGGFL